MCAACGMAAFAGASGAKSWLQVQHGSWLTPARMRGATAALFVAATLVSSIGLSGSSAPHHHVTNPAQSHAR